MKRLFFALLVGLVALAVVVLLRTAMFPSKQVRVAPAPPLELDRDAAVQTFAGALRFKTVSNADPSHRAFSRSERSSFSSATMRRSAATTAHCVPPISCASAKCGPTSSSTRAER